MKFLFYFSITNNYKKKPNSNKNPDEDKQYNQLILQDVDRVYTTLKQVVRDWSSEGFNERKECYGIILEELKNIFPSSNNKYT